MSTPADLSAEVTAAEREAPVKLLGRIATNYILEREASNVYLRGSGIPSVYRSGLARYVIPDSWEIGKGGIIAEDRFASLLEYLCTKTNSSPTQSFNRVYRVGNCQMRIHYSPWDEPKQLHIRMLPVRAPLLGSYFEEGDKSPTIKALEEAKGLIVVCGPMGGGKSTLQQSIIQHLATTSPNARPGQITDKSGNVLKQLGRHIKVLADPVEYHLCDMPNVIVSEVDCALTESGRRENIPFIEDIMPDVLRSDISALSVGEIREPCALDACMSFAASREPCITTIHASSITTCLVKLFELAGRNNANMESKRLLFSTCLEGIFFVNLIYSVNGKPSPVLEYLPINKSQIRKAIAEVDSNPLRLAQVIEAELKNPTSVGNEAITRDKAVAFARRRQLPETTAIAALGQILGV